jgi:hypothetical protein
LRERERERESRGIERMRRGLQLRAKGAASLVLFSPRGLPGPVRGEPLDPIPLRRRAKVIPKWSNLIVRVGGRRVKRVREDAHEGEDVGGDEEDDDQREEVEEPRGHGGRGGVLRHGDAAGEGEGERAGVTNPARMRAREIRTASLGAEPAAARDGG